MGVHPSGNHVQVGVYAIQHSHPVALVFAVADFDLA